MNIESNKNKKHVFLALGIDPNPPIIDLDHFKQYLRNHARFLSAQKEHLENVYLKVQLAFFLRFGSAGIKLLEQFVDMFKNDFTIIVDGKFNDIENSMKAYLEFVFCTLSAHAVTINPFLGEKTIKLSLEECAKYTGEKGRVFVLCSTSESSESKLSYLQSNWENKLSTVAQIRDQIFQQSPQYNKIAGVVIGANKENILLSKELSESKLSVLVPGLGAQGGNWNLIHQCAQKQNEFIFNVGREIFSGGSFKTKQMKKNLTHVQTYFKKSEIT